MKGRVQLHCDAYGKPEKVEMSYARYKRLMNKIRKYEQIIKVKQDLKVAFDEVKEMEKSGRKFKTMKEILHDL